MKMIPKRLPKSMPRPGGAKKAGRPQFPKSKGKMTGKTILDEYGDLPIR